VTDDASLCSGGHPGFFVVDSRRISERLNPEIHSWTVQRCGAVGVSWSLETRRTTIGLGQMFDLCTRVQKGRWLKMGRMRPRFMSQRTLFRGHLWPVDARGSYLSMMGVEYSEEKVLKAQGEIEIRTLPTKPLFCDEFCPAHHWAYGLCLRYLARTPHKKTDNFQVNGKWVNCYRRCAGCVLEFG